MINDFQLEQHQKKKRGSVHLPKIVTPSSMKDRGVITPPETQSKEKGNQSFFNRKHRKKLNIYDLKA